MVDSTKLKVRCWIEIGARVVLHDVSRWVLVALTVRYAKYIIVFEEDSHSNLNIVIREISGNGKDLCFSFVR